MGQIMTKHAKEFGFILKETGACSFLLFISCTHNVWGGGEGRGLRDYLLIHFLPAFIPVPTSSILSADNSQIYTSRFIYLHKAAN